MQEMRLKIADLGDTHIQYLLKIQEIIMKIAALQGLGGLWEAIEEFGSVWGVFISDFALPYRKQY